MCRCKEDNLKNVFNWLYAFVYYYNRLGKHTILDGKTPLKILAGGVKLTASIILQFKIYTVVYINFPFKFLMAFQSNPK
jgi:hypothetical protein